ncbi:MAG TPA: phosphodiester glycosidase family protein [Candidatus Babeliales bacterium]|nr:phosphodiester glycosidase family protein [Candidatus Babeliales bacterium]
MTRTFACAVFLFLGALACASADELPSRLEPSAPFPRILEEAPASEEIAPGVEYADYQLETAAGPLAIHVVAVAPHRSDVRIGSVTADDALTSHGETVGSMAQRTRAVAGINGDFFDIGNTNRPVNMVVRDGVLLQLPYKRYVLAIAHDESPHIAEFTFSGQIQIGEREFSLDGIDELAGGGISLLTPLYGRVPPRDTVTLVALSQLDGIPPLARYRVSGVVDNTSPQPPGYYVAIGLNDYNAVDVPEPGSLVTVSGDVSPLGLDSISAAVGGGALLLHNGQWYDDPDAPNREENSRRMPCSGAAIAPDGRLFLIEVDGRQPELSVGLTRPEFAALMRTLGATEGLLFDGGGSSTLVVRRLGDSAAGVVNSPSDGKERPVADGIFVYSTAPAGPAVRLVARPGTVRAVDGAEVPIRVAAVDAAYHVAETGDVVRAEVSPARLGFVRNDTFVALRPGTGRLELRAGSLRGSVPIEIDATPARSRITPARPNVDLNADIALTARAYDAHGYPLALPSLLRWSSTAGSIDSAGRFHAGTHDADVSVRIGETVATARVTVGSHDVALPFAERARFVTARRGGEGSLARDVGCGSCIRLTYAFGNGERAAYAFGDVALPPDTIGLEFDLLDDGSAARVRVSVRNEIDEDVLLDATQLGEPGWRNVTVHFPPDTQAARLMAIYVLPPKGIELSQGSIVLRNVRAVVAGQQTTHARINAPTPPSMRSAPSTTAKAFGAATTSIAGYDATVPLKSKPPARTARPPELSAIACGSGRSFSSSTAKSTAGSPNSAPPRANIAACAAVNNTALTTRRVAGTSNESYGKSIPASVWR